MADFQPDTTFSPAIASSAKADARGPSLSVSAKSADKGSSRSVGWSELASDFFHKTKLVEMNFTAPLLHMF